MQALGGHNSWSALVRLETGADAFVIDHANDGQPLHVAALEAVIRRLWAANANTQIVLVSSPNWIGVDTSINANVHNPYNADELTDIKTMAEYYGIPYADYWQWCKDVVDAETYDLTELTADKTHPTALGYAQMAELVKPLVFSGGAKPSPLPARLYDSEGLENTPTRVNGNTGTETGTGWSDAGAAGRQSSTAGDTIAFTATCESYGVYRADGATLTVEVDIDGGGFASVTLWQNGIDILAGRAAHTITIKVVSGTLRVDEFWAV